MTKQFKAMSAFAERGGFEIVELWGAILALAYGVWLTYPTPESASLLAVDAYGASFLAIGSGQLIGMVQRRYLLRCAMSLLAVLIWVFTAFYWFELAQVVFVANAVWGFLRITRSGAHSTRTPQAGREPIGMGTNAGVCSA